MLSNSFFFSQTTPSKLESSIALLKYRFDCFSEIYLIRLSRRVLESIFLKMHPTDLCSKNLGTNALKMFHHTAKLLINCLFSIWWSKFIFVMGFFNHFFFLRLMLPRIPTCTTFVLLKLEWRNLGIKEVDISTSRSRNCY